VRVGEKREGYRREIIEGYRVLRMEDTALKGGYRAERKEPS
jgi:hypothetical protein